MARCNVRARHSYLRGTCQQSVYLRYCSEYYEHLRHWRNKYGAVDYLRFCSSKERCSKKGEVIFWKYTLKRREWKNARTIYRVHRFYVPVLHTVQTKTMPNNVNLQVYPGEKVVVFICAEFHWLRPVGKGYLR